MITFTSLFSVVLHLLLFFTYGFSFSFYVLRVQTWPGSPAREPQGPTAAALNNNRSNILLKSHSSRAHPVCLHPSFYFAGRKNYRQRPFYYFHVFYLSYLNCLNLILVIGALS